MSRAKAVENIQGDAYLWGVGEIEASAALASITEQLGLTAKGRSSDSPDGQGHGEVRVVFWVDSSLQNVQVGRGDYPKPEVIRSVGFVVEETDSYLVLARDDMKDDEFRGLICIPRECLKSGRRAT